jgi:hypothetical protein
MPNNQKRPEKMHFGRTLATLTILGLMAVTLSACVGFII